mmetsp:Transcript_78379/g.254623  ORF Transcript_78379/g.254623 Transcript_78379/m.254623 type:complete len:227 (+) Transcript_78379:983-1663(+)
MRLQKPVVLSVQARLRKDCPSAGIHTGAHAGTQASVNAGAQAGPHAGAHAGTHAGAHASSYAGALARLHAGAHASAYAGTHAGTHASVHGSTHRSVRRRLCQVRRRGLERPGDLLRRVHMRVREPVVLPVQAGLRSGCPQPDIGAYTGARFDDHHHDGFDDPRVDADAGAHHDTHHGTHHGTNHGTHPDWLHADVQGRAHHVGDTGVRVADGRPVRVRGTTSEIHD